MESPRKKSRKSKSPKATRKCLIHVSNTSSSDVITPFTVESWKVITHYFLHSFYC